MELKTLISGRMNRVHFAMYWAALIVVKLLLIHFSAACPGEVSLWGMRIVDVPLSLVMLWAMVKRFHDLGWPTFLGIIPLINFVAAYIFGPTFIFGLSDRNFFLCVVFWVSLMLMLCCLFLSGSKEANKYGPSHPKEKDRFQEADTDMPTGKTP